MEILLLAIAVIGTAFKIGIPILLIIFLIKGIRYINRRNYERDEEYAENERADASATLDEIEEELSALREELNDTRR